MDKLSPEHRLLDLISKESSRIKKLQMLDHFKRSKKLKNIFLYSLDPFKKYYIKKFPDTKECVGIGDCVIDDQTWKVLDQLTHRVVSGKDAKRLLFAHMRDLTPSESRLLKQIVLHRLDVGISFKTANQVWPKLVVDRFVQKAEDYDSGQLVLPSYAGIKLDGIRADYKEGVFTSRSGHTIPGLDHIADYIDANGGGHWDGELLVPKLSLSFDTVSGYIRSGLKEKVDARYVIFDNLTIHTLKQSIRLESMEHFPRYLTSQGTDNAPATYLHHLLFHEEEAIMTYFSIALRAGEEGLIVKHPRARYRAGRTYNWMKLKKGDSEEYEIVDYFAGEGKLSNTLGGVVVQTTPTTTTRVGSGFSDQARREIWEDPSKILGRMATINFMEKTTDGSLRHPIYKGIRWDI